MLRFDFTAGPALHVGTQDNTRRFHSVSLLEASASLSGARLRLRCVLAAMGFGRGPSMCAAAPHRPARMRRTATHPAAPPSKPGIRGGTGPGTCRSTLLPSCALSRRWFNDARSRPP